MTAILLFSCKNNPETENTSEVNLATEETTGSDDLSASTFKVHPISHASLLIEWEGSVLYIDPVGGGEAYQDQPTPDLILITDIHGDHLNVETLEAVTAPSTQIFAPPAVGEKLSEMLSSKTTIISNGETKEFRSFTIEAIPMYNLREEALKYHEKGRGNGYVIDQKDERVYISGDTEDIPEMRQLKHIDHAFVCMNLPYTMTVEKAAEAVLDFRPNKVYPYHYRGSEGPSDVEKFRSLVKENSETIEVVQLDWYPNDPF